MRRILKNQSLLAKKYNNKIYKKVKIRVDFLVKAKKIKKNNKIKLKINNLFQHHLVLAFQI